MEDKRTFLCNTIYDSILFSSEIKRPARPECSCVIERKTQPRFLSAGSNTG